MKTPFRLFATALLALTWTGRTAFASGRAPHAGPKSLIYYSQAPWDGGAYALVIGLKGAGAAADPHITINVWGNPEFPKATTLAFNGDTSSKAAGRASYQAVLDQTAPEDLTGTVSFKALRKGKPVTGSYDLKNAQGRTFKGKFEAHWGNTEEARQKENAPATPR